jgi:hypothetical protein
MKKKRARPGDHITIEYEDVIGGKIRTVAAYTQPPDADVKPYFLPGWNGLWDPADDGSNWLLFTTPAVDAEVRRIIAKPHVTGDSVMRESPDGMHIWFTHPPPEEYEPEFQPSEALERLFERDPEVKAKWAYTKK